MNTFRKIHLWLSVPFGIIITLVCFSGAMLIFEPEITRSVRHDVYYVASHEATPLPMSTLLETAQASVPDSVEITGVTVYNDPERTYQVNLSKPRRAALFIDQYTGEITGRYERLGFFSTMFGLHRWLLDSADPHGEGAKIGKLVVGISVLVFVIALITGIVIWVPRARKNFKKSISLSRKKIWKSLHVAGGMYAVLLVLAMALTGLTWSFPWYRSVFYAVCGVENTPRQIASSVEGRESKESREGREERHGHAHHEGRNGHGVGRERHEEHHHHSPFGQWQNVYDQLQQRYPEASQITVQNEAASVTLSNYGNPRAADQFSFNRHSGKLTSTTAYADASDTDKLRGWIYSIHIGNFGGLFSRILWLLAALLGASLPITGYYIWIRRLRRKH